MLARARLILITLSVLLAISYFGVRAFQLMAGTHRGVVELPSGLLLPRGLPVVPFQLVGPDGLPIDNQRLKGHWTLVFSGYMHCPSICPTTLETLRRGLHDLPGLGSQFEVWFLTLDPDSDPPDELARFVHGFDARFLAVTGTRENVERFATSQMVHFERGVDGVEKDRVVAHDVRVLIFNPDGELAGYLSPPLTPENVKASVIRLLKSTSTVPQFP